MSALPIERGDGEKAVTLIPGFGVEFPVEMRLQLVLEAPACTSNGEKCIPGRGNRMSKDRGITQFRYTTENAVFLSLCVFISSETPQAPQLTGSRLGLGIPESPGRSQPDDILILL